jgi:hypothetical protein
MPDDLGLRCRGTKVTSGADTALLLLLEGIVNRKKVAKVWPFLRLF